MGWRCRRGGCRAGVKRPMRGDTFLFERFLPVLGKAGLTGAEIRRLTQENPARAFRVRRHGKSGRA
jgi:predicted metal-dependent phosphotriesterase family hydrolase